MLTQDRPQRAGAAPPPAPGRPGGPAPETVLLLAIIVVGATLRLTTLGTQSFWTDEATTAHLMRLPFGEMLHAVRAGESTPPLYYLLLWLWAKVGGTGEVGLRSLSALCGIALIPVAYLCTRELLSRAAALVVAALAAVNPFLIWYSQEARAYALFALLGALSLLFCLRAVQRPDRRALSCWAVASALTVLTHFFAGFLVAAEAVLLLAYARSGPRRPLRDLIAACGVLLVAQLAMLPWLIGDLSHPLRGWITAFPLSVRIQQIPVQFGLGSLYQSSLVRFGLLGSGVLALVVVALVVGGGGARERRGVAIAVALAAVVVGAPLLLAAAGEDLIVPRNLILGWLPLAIVLAAACTVPRARVPGALLAIALLAAFVWAGVRVAQNPQYQRPDWRGVAAALGPPGTTRAVVAYDGAFAALPLQIYLRGVPWGATPPGPVSVGEVDVVGSTWQSSPARLPPGVTLIASRTVKGFRVDRFALAGGWHGTPAQIGARATGLLGPAPPGPSVLIQPT